VSHAYPHLKALIGKRVRLQYTNDPYTKLRQGDEGVIDFVDDTGTVSVKWDSGSSLGLNAEFGDRWIVLD
jgi:Domain of unknown function (DUF4314)